MKKSDFCNTKIHQQSNHQIIRIMKTVIRNLLVVIAGVVIGGLVNMGIVMISGSIIPPPEGVDSSSMESLKANMHLFEVRHFIFPFLAHALGTLAGAFIVGLFVVKHKLILSLIIGVFFLIGGIWMVLLVPSPLWFTIVDLGLAYLPMAWLGAKLGGLVDKKNN